MNNNNNDNFEILFWKVIKNQFLFKLIIKHIRYCCEDVVNNNQFNFKKDYNDYFKKIVKFKNLSSLKLMIENNEIQLLLYKLKNDEFINVNCSSLVMFTEYFNQKIIINHSTNTTSTTESYVSLFKEILMLLLNNQLIIEEDYYSTLLKTEGQTFELILDIFEELNIQIPESFKNKLIYKFYSNNNLETLLLYKNLYNTPVAASAAALTSNKRLKQTNDVYSTPKDERENEKVELIKYEYLKYVNSVESQIKLCTLGFIDYSNSQNESIKDEILELLNSDFDFYQGHFYNEDESNKIKRTLFKELLLSQKEWSNYSTYNPVKQLNNNKTFEEKISIFLKTITNCHIESLMFLKDEDWELLSKTKFDVSNIQFPNDEKSIIKLIEYLNKKAKYSINLSFLIDEIILKSSKPPPPYQSILITNEYYLKIFYSSIDGCLSFNNRIIEFLFQNYENNPIINNYRDIIFFYNDQSYILLNLYYLSDEKINVNSIISKIELFINFQNTINFNDGRNRYELSACESIIQFLFNKLISSSNVTIDQLKYIYHHISNNNIIINHQIHHSVNYLARKSPISIIYLMKILNYQQPNYEYSKKRIITDFINYIDYNEFTFDWIYGLSSLPPSSDELLLKFMDLSTEQWHSNNQNNFKSYSELLNFKFEFLLSASRVIFQTIRSNETTIKS